MTLAVRCSGLIALDLDGTLLGPGDAVSPRSVEELSSLIDLGFLVVPVTAKTIWEVARLWREDLRLGQPLIVVAESGGAIYAAPGLLSSPDGLDDVLRMEYMELAPSLDEIGGELDYVASACPGFVRLSRADTSTASKLTGLAPSKAALAVRRRYLEVLWHPDEKCLEKAMERAVEAGLYAHRSRRFLHVGGVKGKGYALKALNKEPIAAACRPVVGVGDSDADEDLLLASELAVHVPSGSPGRPERRIDRLVSPEEAPEAFWWVSQRIVKTLVYAPPRT